MDKITEIIKSYFDSEKWKYMFESNNDGTLQSLYSQFTGNNEILRFRINVFPNDKICQILCQPSTKINPNNILGAIQAINEFNLHSRLVCGCIGENGDIAFWLGRNTDGDTFSQEAFAADFHIVFNAAEEETAQIFKKAILQTPVDRRNRRRGLFSFFK